MTAHELMVALAARHAKDLFIDECKTGSSWNGARRLDAWVLCKTWSPFTTIGYEVKVDRGDFLGDSKWPAYLEVCHELYFVCPPKLIAVEELPPQVGLLWAHGQRFSIKRRAARREPDEQALIRTMAYVLMSRSRPVANMWDANREDGAAYWKKWLALKSENQDLGRAVSSRVHKIVAEARNKQREAERLADSRRRVDERLETLGLPAGTTEWEAERLLRERFNGGIDQIRLNRLRHLASELVRGLE